jgi:branched-chain amino acid transport system substrate-binding protein
MRSERQFFRSIQASETSRTYGLCLASWVLALSIHLIGQSAAMADIVVAVVSSTSRAQPGTSLQVKVGAEQAIADINASGGWNGRQVRLVIDDDQCNPQQAAIIAARLVNDGVSMVVGHFCSQASAAAAPIYSRGNVIQIEPFMMGRTNVEAYRTCCRPDRDPHLISSYIAKEFTGKAIGIAYESTPRAQERVASVKSALEKSQVGRVKSLEISNGDGRSVQSLVAWVRSENFDILYVETSPAIALEFVRQLGQINASCPIIIPNSPSEQPLAELGILRDNIIVSMPPDLSRDPGNRELVERFRRSGNDTSRMAMLTYAAFQTYTQAARLSGRNEYSVLRHVLSRETFRTTLGEIKFDAERSNELFSPALFKWESNVLRQIWGMCERPECGGGGSGGCSRPECG